MSIDSSYGCVLAAQPTDAAAVQGDDAPRRLLRLEGFEAPFSLNPAERDAYLRRFTTLFVPDRVGKEGAGGTVLRAVNATGEVFAIKVLKASDDTEAAWVEYAVLQRLSGIQGFPRLYGRGKMDGAPVIVMEWIEGDTAARMRQRLAIDAAGRLSPLTVARFGRDLFAVLARVDALSDKVVHADISLGNVMVATARMSVEEQQEDGAFDVRITDLGSASLLGDVKADRTGATPAFASPEALDPQRGVVSQASDVYSAACLIYELLCGSAPFAEASGVNPAQDAAMRANARPNPICTVHAGAADTAAALIREPEVAVAVGHAAAEVSPAPDTQQVRAALVMADSQLEEVLSPCWAADPRKRPSAAEMRDALQTFCTEYADNIGRALRGDPLAPCRTSLLRRGIAGMPLPVRARVRVAGKAAATVIGLVVVAASAVLLGSSRIEVIPAVGGWSGNAGGFNVAAFLMLPAVLGALFRWRQMHARAGFIRACVGVVAGAAIAAVAALVFPFASVDASHAVWAALFACTACTWCVFVMDYALPPERAVARHGLPGNAGVGDDRLFDAPVYPTAIEEGTREGA